MKTFRLILATILTGVLCGHFASTFGQHRSLYKVTDNNNRIGFIDKVGKIVIGFDRLPAEAVVSSFSEGFAPICFLGRIANQCGYIDETGKIAIRGGLAAIKTQEGWGFIDKRGRFISTKRYETVENFSEGLAAVADKIGTKSKYGFINQTGEEVIPLRFDPRLGPHSQPMNLGRFKEGLAAARIGNVYGYIDYKGNIVIAPRFRNAAEFSEGLASVTNTDGQNGYIDKTGLFVIRATSGGGGQFNEGLATFSVEIDGRTKMGYIDRTGKTIIEPKFDMAYDFVDGIAEVYLVEKLTSGKGPTIQTVHGYIDKAGRFIWRSP